MLGFGKWDARETFTTLEASYLWYEVDPDENPSNETAAKIDGMYQRLKDAFQWEEIKHTETILQNAGSGRFDRIRAWVQSVFTVSREKLRAKVEIWGEKPSFLFPEDRNRRPFLHHSIVKITPEFDKYHGELLKKETESVPDTRLSKHSEITEEADNSVSNDFEVFVRKLRVSYESDSEIKMQEPRMPAKLYNCIALGFRDQRVKTWKMLLSILQAPDHSWNIGSAHVNSGGKKQIVRYYSSQLKLLGQINIKLGNFIGNTYGRQMPKKFKIYERLKMRKVRLMPSSSR